MQRHRCRIHHVRSVFFALICLLRCHGHHGTDHDRHAQQGDEERHAERMGLSAGI